MLVTPFLVTQLIFRHPKIPKEMGRAVVVEKTIQELQPISVVPADELPIILTVQAPPTMNLFDGGNCTWYVASKLAIPNEFGNARDWLRVAQVEGYQTGSAPRVGVVAWFSPGMTLGHVALVTAVYPNGSFLISEMNVKGLGVVSERLITQFNGAFIY